MKKIGATILVKNGHVVNSTCFSTFRPIGSIDRIITRLQQWEVDEITVLNLSHSDNVLGDFNMLFSQSLLASINTPIAYGGGIKTRLDAESVIKAGCERVVLSGSHWTPKKSKEISVNLGDQAVLIHVPLIQRESEFSVHNSQISFQKFLDYTPIDWGGELYLKDRDMDGLSTRIAFFKNLSSITKSIKSPILVGGGISCVQEAKQLLEISTFKGIVVGNWFSRAELVIPKIKREIGQSFNLRAYVGCP